MNNEQKQRARTLTKALSQVHEFESRHELLTAAELAVNMSLLLQELIEQAASAPKPIPVARVLSDAEMGVGFDRKYGAVIWFGTPLPGNLYAEPVEKVELVATEAEKGNV